MRFEMPEDSLPEAHRARLLWQLVETLDLSAFAARAKSVEGRAGRPVASAQMQLVLWLYAISVGVGSAREIERRTRTDTAFEWIVGDQKVSHDTLSVFRVEHGAALDGLMTDVLGVLLHKGLLALDLVAQDGTRVRASAAAPSFRREASRTANRAATEDVAGGCQSRQTRLHRGVRRARRRSAHLRAGTTENTRGARPS
jgi:transposase